MLFYIFLRHLDLDTPDYMSTFAGIVSTLLTLQLPPEEVDNVIDILADAFSLPEDIKLFLEEHYLPEVANLYLMIIKHQQDSFRFVWRLKISMLEYWKRLSLNLTFWQPWSS